MIVALMRFKVKVSVWNVVSGTSILNWGQFLVVTWPALYCEDKFTWHTHTHTHTHTQTVKSFCRSHKHMKCTNHFIFEEKYMYFKVFNRFKRQTSFHKLTFPESLHASYTSDVLPCPKCNQNFISRYRAYSRQKYHRDLMGIKTVKWSIKACKSAKKWRSVRRKTHHVKIVVQSCTYSLAYS